MFVPVESLALSSVHPGLSSALRSVRPVKHFGLLSRFYLIVVIIMLWTK